MPVFFLLTQLPDYQYTLLFLNLGAGEIFIIALFILMFFGSKQIPSLMRGLGKSMREFKDAMNGIEREVRSVVNTDIEPPPPPSPPPKLSDGEPKELAD
jgi:sec-independent protein translocase protein TatA